MYTLTMEDKQIKSLDQVAAVLNRTEQVELVFTNKEELYGWITGTLSKFQYHGLATTKKQRGSVIRYIEMMTSLSKGHVKKLIKRKKEVGAILRKHETRHRFPTKYQPTDIARLIETDKAHSYLSGEATKRILKREYERYDKAEYAVISQISVAHLYRLRDTNQYQSATLHLKKTNPVQVAIGIRKKPHTDGRPGFLRVDSVHQGDLDKEKGVYHINLVDTETQWEIIGCVQGISEFFLEPLLALLLEQFPFVILGFHSDNGSEYINKTVANLLQKLFIEQTKSRSYHCNDNALGESKNGSVIRKHMGYAHIPRKYAPLINGWYQGYFNEYLNFHRPCGFATEIMDERGKIKKRYDTYLTPFERLKSLPNAEKYLKDGISMESLEKIANRMSDNESAAEMQDGKEKLSLALKSC